MYCMHCGEQIPDNSRFCKYCGKLVKEDEINIVNSADTQTNESEDSVVEIFEEISEINDDENNVEKSSADELLNSALEITENEPEIEIVDDYLFEHITPGKRIALFIGAVLITAIVAVVVFASFFPELV